MNAPTARIEESGAAAARIAASKRGMTKVNGGLERCR